jgi:hypothetical protein
MISRISILFALAALISLPFVTAGCEESHSETTKQNLLGGTTHEETTTYRNPDGSVSVDHSKQVTH